MRREKITITIRDDILKGVDRIINKKEIRNRSHAIEYLLEQGLQPRVQKAVIAVGGRSDQPKSSSKKSGSELLSFEGKLLLEHQLELLADFGIRNIALVTDHNSSQLKERFGDGNAFGVTLQYVEQGAKEIGTGYALHLVKNFIGDEPLIMIYGDVFIEINLDDFVEEHIKNQAVATAALTSIADPSLYGVVNVRGGKIKQFIEKPNKETEVSRVISAGVFCFQPSIFEYLNNKKNLSLEKDIFPMLTKEGNLGGYLFEGKWCNVWNQMCYEGRKK